MKKSNLLTIVLAVLAFYFLSVALLDYYKRNTIAEKLSSQIQTAKSDVQTIADALKDYVKDTGTLPTNEQGIEALISNPRTPPAPISWQGPYLQKDNWIDPWGQHYQYIRYLHGNDKHSFIFQVFSYGPNKDDKVDDVVSTNRHETGRLKKEAEPIGFQGISWGSLFDDIKGKTLKSVSCPYEDEGFFWYINENDSLVYEGVPVKSIVYEFWQNKFYGVLISMQKSEPLQQMKRELIRKFGLPNGYEEFGGQHNFSIHWEGKISKVQFSNFAPEQLHISSNQILSE